MCRRANYTHTRYLQKPNAFMINIPVTPLIAFRIESGEPAAGDYSSEHGRKF